MKVIKRFNDKKTKKRYEVGDDYRGEREKELQAKGFLEKAGKKQRTVSIKIGGPVDKEYLRDSLLPAIQEEINKNDVTLISGNSAQGKALRENKSEGKTGCEPENSTEE